MTKVNTAAWAATSQAASDGEQTTRCLIYLRVSSREQAEEGYSIPAQREACSRLIGERGWVFVDEYVDAGESARTADRPAFQALLKRLPEERSINCLVVHKLDRLARNLEDHVTVRAKLRKLGVRLVSVSESLEESASGKLVEGILASIAEFYSANLSQEIRKGTLEKVRQGGWPRPAPVGYRNVRLGSNGRRGEAVIVPDEGQAHLVRQAFELYATGEWPLKRLHEEMARRGLRTRRGRMIARSKLAELLKNKIYIGKVVWQGVEYEGRHESLVSEELFRRVQDVFQLHDRAGERRRRHSHYLRGTLFCGACGSRLSSMIAKGRFPYFFCLGAHQRRTGCTEPYVPVGEIERQVEDLYREIRFPDDLREEVAKALEAEIARREGGRVRSVRLWGRTLERLTAEREKLVRAYYAEAIPLDLLKREQARIEVETAGTQRQLALDEAKLATAKETIEVALQLASDCHRSYRRATPTTRRRWNQAFFKAVCVKDRRIVRVVYRAPFDGLPPAHGHP